MLLPRLNGLQPFFGISYNFWCYAKINIRKDFNLVAKFENRHIHQIGKGQGQGLGPWYMWVIVSWPKEHWVLKVRPYLKYLLCVDTLDAISDETTWVNRESERRHKTYVNIWRLTWETHI